MVAVHYLLRGDSFLAGTQSDGHSVLVTAAYHHNVLAFEAQETCIYIGRYIYSGKMADMYRSVGIGESCGYECALEILFHCDNFERCF